MAGLEEFEDIPGVITSSGRAWILQPSGGLLQSYGAVVPLGTVGVQTNAPVTIEEYRDRDPWYLVVPYLKDRVMLLAQLAGYFGITLVLTSAFRTYAEQAALNDHDQPEYPVATPGHSQHEYGCAVDLVSYPTGTQALVGQLGKLLGIAWSGADEVHFAVFTSEQWRQLLNRFGV